MGLQKRNNPHRSKHPIVLYDWHQSRKADHPREFLKDFSGTVVTDGYQIYHKLGKELLDLQIAGCWIHTRRPFAEIMHIDNSFDDLTNRDCKKQRQLVLQEKVDAYFA